MSERLTPRALWLLRGLAGAIITGLVVYDRSCRWSRGDIYCPSLGQENGVLATIGIFAIAIVLVMIIERLRWEHIRNALDGDTSGRP